jgi:regulator of sigma E protease
VLSVVVFVHEYGHFSIARLFHTKVNVFSIGFGKEIFGWTDKYNTRWKISWIPLGGYVSFAGDKGVASEDDDNFFENMLEQEKKNYFAFKPKWQKACIVFAGPAYNIIFTFLTFTVLFFISGYTQLVPVISDVVEGKAAAKAGVIKGDRIIAADNQSIDYFADLEKFLFTFNEKSFTLTVNRDGKNKDIIVEPVIEEVKDRYGNKLKVARLGVAFDPEKATYVKNDIKGSVIHSGKQMFFIVTSTFDYLSRLIVGEADMDQLSGPLKIGSIAGQAAQDGIAQLFFLIAVLSLSIGLVNLFPIPMLDGGHLALYAVEGIMRQDINNNIKEVLFKVGMAFVAFVMLFTIFNDIRHIMN